MKLSELKAQFLLITEPGRGFKHVDDVSIAQGIMFLCPKCFVTNKGPVGTHSVLCWFAGRGVSDQETPGPGRWHPVGTGYDDLSLVAGSSSVRLVGGCNAHFHVTGGSIHMTP